jgi:hypothetical protein
MPSDTTGVMPKPRAKPRKPRKLKAVNVWLGPATEPPAKPAKPQEIEAVDVWLGPANKPRTKPFKPAKQQTPKSYQLDRIRKTRWGTPLVNPADRHGRPPNASGAYPTRRDLIQAALRAGYKLRQAAMIDPDGSECLPVKCPDGWALCGPSGSVEFAWIPAA